MVDCVCRSFAISELDIVQSIQNCSQTLTIVHLHKAFNVLENKVLRAVLVNVLMNLPEELSSAFVIVKTLLFASLTKGLTWKASAIYIHVPSEMSIRVLVLDVLEQLLRLPVACDRFSRYRVDLATEFVLVVDL